MYGTLFRFDTGRILQEAYPSGIGVLVPAQFGANLTILRGQAVAQKTSDLKMYPLNRAASDGTQTFGGWSQQDFATDANGIAYLVNGGTSASPSYFQSGQETATFWRAGDFKPGELLTSPVGTPTAEVDTVTPTNPTTGDIYSVYNAAGVGVSVTVGSTQTATATVTLLKNAWNADPACVAIAAASGTATFILTAATLGVPLGLTATAVGTGTTALVVTTAAVSGQQKEVDTFTPGGTIATGYTYTLTITYPNLVTHAVTYTALSSDTTATLICNGLRAAWAADSLAANYAVPTGTATLILTAANLGQTMNIAVSNTGASGTFTKSVTNAAYGYSFADVTATRPGAYIEQPTGYVVCP